MIEVISQAFDVGSDLDVTDKYAARIRSTFNTNARRHNNAYSK